MATTVWGVVKDGRIVPSSSLPEGARVEIKLFEPAADVPHELLEELAGWDNASANALELVEYLAGKSKADRAT
ncbi:MAG: hypothetical protein U0800_15280 [Isosphaeraceae bacterium]